MQIFQVLDKDKDGMFSTLDVEQLAEDDSVSIESCLKTLPFIIVIESYYPQIF